jgi:Asp-tRNA(Asn)/Glu-tRNA(Gln) amidotransferase A subunit family amidase
MRYDSGDIPGARRKESLLVKELAFMTRARIAALLLLSVLFFASGDARSQARPFRLLETTIEDVHAAYRSGQLTARQLVQAYLARIEAYEKRGVAINSIITLNPKALEEADRLDAAFKKSGFVGPLHGIPIVIKDQVDVAGFPTTLGSILLKDYYPGKDGFAIAKLRNAGAIVLAKTTLGEFGGGDAIGSLFGATKNPYALERTAGGSSGGTGAALAANFATVGVGEEGSASIRRPSTWNSLVGMHPTAGLVSRSGMWDGWPAIYTSLGPMSRTVTDLAKLLDAMVGYDPEDPLTALGMGQAPGSYTSFLDRNGMKGARIGIIREPIGGGDPADDDFKKVDEAFQKAVQELRAAGADLVDPVVIPDMRALVAKRNTGPEWDENIKFYLRSPNAPFHSREEIARHPDFGKVAAMARGRLTAATDPARYYQHLLAREELLFNVLKVMADNRLDALAYKSIEHQPRLIADVIADRPNRGVPTMSTFLGWVPTLTVPAGFTRDNLPIGVTFQGRPFGDGTLIKLAYAYEQATRHRRPPASVPDLN